MSSNLAGCTNERVGRLTGFFIDSRWFEFTTEIFHEENIAVVSSVERGRAQEFIPSTPQRKRTKSAISPGVPKAF